jgi:hypothetical protein
VDVAELAAWSLSASGGGISENDRAPRSKLTASNRARVNFGNRKSSVARLLYNFQNNLREVK